MATKTNIEVKVNLQCGPTLVMQGRYVLEDHPAVADLQAEIDAKTGNVESLGTFEDTPTSDVTAQKRTPAGA